MAEETAVAFDSKFYDSMIARYSRALHLTPPKLAGETPGLAVEGYWLDARRYFFLSEKFESSAGRVVETPAIADCESQSVAEVISLEALASILSQHTERPLDREALFSAQFDMPDAGTLAVTAQGRNYLINVAEGKVFHSSKALDVPALYSPNGCFAIFVRSSNVWIRDRRTEAEHPLTHDGEPHYCYGQNPSSSIPVRADNTSLNPMGLWSADSAWFITHRIDERLVPDLPLIQHVPAHGGRPVAYRYKYPMPGDALPITTLVAIHVATGRVVEFDEFSALTLGYSPFFWRMVWFCGSDVAWFVRVDRYFKKAELIRLDLAGGTARIVISETVSSGYIDLHHVMAGTPNVRTLRESNEIIWFSERDGWGHLYLYDAESGVLKNQITRGDWLVRDIVHVDEVERRILFLAGGIDQGMDPARRSLCAVNFDGSGFEILLAHDGDVFVPKTEPSGFGYPFRASYALPGIAPGGRFAVVRYASVERGNVTAVVNLATRTGFPIASARPAPHEVPPRHFTVLAADGQTVLHGVMFFPSDFDEKSCYPLIDHIYPGPQISHKPQSFRTIKSGHCRALAELGFVTIMLDTRGMPFRSRAFHQSSYGELLEPQLADHAAAVRQLCERHSFIDSRRIGMLGNSGGGAATARALFEYGSVFKVGVSSCGNHDSSFNISLWSDKYRGPGSTEHWAKQANGAAAKKLRGKLLLISGDMDETVHVGHTLTLVDALVRANRDFDLLIVPNAGHAVLMTNGYVQRRVWDYFVFNLLAERPPQDFQIRFEPHELSRLEKNWIRDVWQ